MPGLGGLLHRWILLDVHDPRAPLVLMIGEELHNAKAPKRVLNKDAIPLILPFVVTAVETGEDLVSLPRVGSLRVRVQLTRSPVTRTVVAALAVLETPSNPAPPAPLMGAWEWVISQPLSDRPGSRVTHWSPEIAHLYGYDDEDVAAAVGAMPTSDWQNRMIDPADRNKIYAYIEQGTTHLDDGLYILGYKIRTTRGKEQMRLIGRGLAGTDGTTTGYVGLSHRTHGPVEDRTNSLDPPEVAAFAQGVIDLSDDAIFALVNLADRRIYDRSGPKRWASIGLDPVAGQDVAAALHPDDREKFAVFVDGVTIAAPDTGIYVRMRTSTKDWKQFRVLGTQVLVGGTAHILVRLHATDHVQ